MDRDARGRDVGEILSALLTKPRNDPGRMIYQVSSPSRWTPNLVELMQQVSTICTIGVVHIWTDATARNSVFQATAGQVHLGTGDPCRLHATASWACLLRCLIKLPLNFSPLPPPQFLIAHLVHEVAVFNTRSRMLSFCQPVFHPSAECRAIQESGQERLQRRCSHAVCILPWTTCRSAALQ